MCFALADLDGSIPGENPGLVESLEGLLEDPPNGKSPPF
jgi:hypothetical protein